ncbi:hypothetical protein BN7_1325 [Wickerhamomyces ciferrii]|uniref:RING-type domain-containing protein n=1 Tax=Wickerhamomyces ciferrii (strain ATCC 14091 / BCRC 22168 / CBS 111 / JCM 3599 / NBRC 0793 / NRRL Y-1031 F-60-10) TaxID=1206466 RepID=K0KFV6_WICCF|nr:uncharacterized protein BN7_1325 [Wickerhamomyces ciferrii]CCH41786.1 hypothetical protein BN7_1325 [Wickerhamomyces ciferrii]
MERFGEDNSENVILNLPNVLLNNSDSTNTVPNQTPPSSQQQQQQQQSSPNRPSGAPASAGDHSRDNNDANASNNGNNNQDSTTADDSRPGISSAGNDTTQRVPEEHIERNMLVSVSYVYGDNNRPQTGAGATNGAQDNQRGDRTGSLLLNVPNIPNNRNENQLNALIEFAASLALSAIAANIRRNNGIKKETFEKLKIKKKSEVHDKSCAICYDEYDEDEISHGKGLEENIDTKDDKDEDLNGQRKRKRRSSDDGAEESQEPGRKVRRTENVTSPAITSNETAANQTAIPSTSASTGETLNQEKKEEEYKHVPLALPCDHYFGRSCIFEWLKSNSTCPLCRQAIVEEGSNERGPPDQINIPNIASLLNPTSRDHPMIIVLDRSTNTLVRRPEEPSNTPATATAVPQVNTDTPEAAVANSILSTLSLPRVPTTESPPARRDPLSASILRGLSQPRFPGLFSSGVSSRRTETGVETVNLDNDGLTRNDFDNSFYDESRRLIEERLRNRHLRNNVMSPANTESNGPPSAEANTVSQSSSQGETTSRAQAQSQAEPSENNENTNTQPNA